ncbi:hypothetical protein [Methylobacterium sp. 22177]|uniref:hypothetical protein n=1 Tax=Methylobacterium sp. 22177 TaxID=3453885 RepID=UPI003F859CC8
MQGAVKHIAWASSVAACVYFVAVNHWSPVQITAPNQIGSTNTSLGVLSGRVIDEVAPWAARKPVGEPYPRAPEAAVAAIPPTANSSGPLAGAAGPSSSLAAIEDPASARQVMQILGKLEAVADVPPGTPAERVATIFFDPRCPYCHAAFTALHGRIAARWIPVVVLGEPEAGNRMAAAILAASDRQTALATTFDRKQDPGGTPATDLLAKVAENREAFAGVFAAAPSLKPGVPTLFVPRPDGRVTIQVGFQAGDEAKLQALMNGG